MGLKVGWGVVQLSGAYTPEEQQAQGKAGIWECTEDGAWGSRTHRVLDRTRLFRWHSDHAVCMAGPVRCKEVYAEPSRLPLAVGDIIPVSTRPSLQLPGWPGFMERDPTRLGPHPSQPTHWPTVRGLGVEAAPWRPGACCLLSTPL